MHDIAISTFLKDTDGTFVPVTDWRKGVEDPYYIAGAIELTIDGNPILDTGLWDYVDQLWAYILNMLRDLRKADEATTYFPDQPIEFSLKRSNRRNLLVTVRVNAADVRTAYLNEAELTNALLDASQLFFTEMERILPGSSTYELEQIAQLRR